MAIIFDVPRLLNVKPKVMRDAGRQEIMLVKVLDTDSLDSAVLPVPALVDFDSGWKQTLPSNT